MDGDAANVGVVMSIALVDIIQALNDELSVHRFKDYCSNGLQVEGKALVSRVITGVSANQELIDRAVEQAADLIVVHHGLIWGSGLPSVKGITAKRLTALLTNGVSLAGYHLPLDAHGSLGNNAGLCDAIGMEKDRDSFGQVRGCALGVCGALSGSPSRSQIAKVIEKAVGDSPIFQFPYGPEAVGKVGVCTGAASDLIEEASLAGCDVYVTGELSERSEAVAKELQITLIAAGHHRTEVFGPRRLATYIRDRFPEVSAEFIDIAGSV